MLDLKKVRENPQEIRSGLAARNYPAKALDEALALDCEWRKLKTDADSLKAQRNKLSLEVSAAKKEGGKDVGPLIASSQEISAKIKGTDEACDSIEQKMRDMLLFLPNTPDKSVPVGADETANPVIREWGRPEKTARDVLDHHELAQKLDIVDFERGAKLAGSRFVVLKGLGARLERAIIYFMLE
ncbi:serine--tRNA ligase, partial [Candidatus Parvarchaeota archaeon]|nr:serine--tRNA ligase [Candidatus Parvarchaeota archaeon]